MSGVTIIGTGNMGSAIAPVLARGGASMQILDRDRQKSAALVEKVGGVSASLGEPITGEIVVLAVPYPALAEVADLYGSQFDGKILVDISNPLDFATFDELVVPTDSSAAAELQERVPGSRVLKAFNTNFAATVATGQVGDVATTVLVAGDDEGAKQTLVDAVTAGGLAAVAAGSLKRARELEALGFLQMTLAAQEIIGWDRGFALRR